MKYYAWFDGAWILVELSAGRFVSYADRGFLSYVYHRSIVFADYELHFRELLESCTDYRQS